MSKSSFSAFAGIALALLQQLQEGIDIRSELLQVLHPFVFQDVVDVGFFQLSGCLHSDVFLSGWELLDPCFLQLGHGLFDLLILGRLMHDIPINTPQKVSVDFVCRFEVLPYLDNSRVAVSRFEGHPAPESHHQVLEEVGVGLLRRLTPIRKQVLLWRCLVVIGPALLLLLFFGLLLLTLSIVRVPHLEVMIAIGPKILK